MSLIIGTLYRNTVAVPDKIFTCDHCRNCIFFDKNTQWVKKSCIIQQTKSISSCHYNFVKASSYFSIPLIFIPKESRTI